MKQIDKDTISLEWETEDIKQRLQERGEENKLTTDDCRFVLSLMLDKHDATIGINWDVMDEYIDRVIKQKKEERKN